MVKKYDMNDMIFIRINFWSGVIIYLMDIPISDFAKKINFPLCQFMDEFKQWPYNEQK